METLIRDEKMKKRSEKMRSTALALAALVLFLAAPAMSQEKMTDRDDIIAADVKNIVGNHVFYTIYDIVSVEVKDGVVKISGVVTDPYKKSAFLKAVEKRVADVKTIEESIEVLPPSSLDDRIRYIVARKIYNDGRLLRYSLAKWPYPIHIIVRNGHVTLEGEVATKMDSRLIETKVSGIIGVVSMTNNLRIS
jgi:osmotically-inducible protein OsmY